jgi:serine protease Do
MLRAAVYALALAVVAGCASLRHDFTSLVRHEAGAVVRIGSFNAATTQEERTEEELPLDDFLARLLGGEALPTSPVLGSGFVISEDGYIITNAHLVEDAPAGSLVVRFADRREFKATIVGVDPVSDIALVKIEARGLKPVRLGSAARLQPGEWVAAIGSPLGLERSVSAGIVSAVGRTLPEESYLPFIQTDVAINPGNSGGPLFNVRGEVVGVNSVIYSATGGFMGVSFAVPIDIAMKVAHELRTHGKVIRGRIGVRLQELTPELAEALRVPGGEGVIVVDTLRGGPAHAAGLRSGDVVVGFAGKRVAGADQLMDLIAHARPGESVDARIVRDGRAFVLPVAVGEARIAELTREPERMPDDPIGLIVGPLDATRRERLGLPGGVLVRHAEGAAQRAGLSAGDIVLSVNGSVVATPHQFNEQLAAAGAGQVLALLVHRDGARSFVALRLPESGKQR